MKKLTTDRWALAFWLPLTYAILRDGAVEALDWYICLAGIAVATLVYDAHPPPPGRSAALPVSTLDAHHPDRVRTLSGASETAICL